MKQILLIGALLINALLFAQRTGELAFFSNTGEKFYVVLNGIRQNITPETNVKVTGLTNPYYACKIVAANNSFTIEKNVMVSMDTLVTYQIIGKKGKYKLRGYSQTALNVTPADPNQTVIVYHPTENTGTTNVGTTGTTGTTNVGTTGTTGTTETVTTTTTVGTTGTTTTVGTTGTTGNVGTTTTVGTTGTTGNVGTTTTVGTTGTTGNTTESVNININVTENGMGINMNATGTGTGTENMNSSTNVNGNGSTTVTTSSSTTGGNGTTTYYEETTTTTTTTTTTSTTGNTMYADPDMTVTMTTTGNVNGTTGTSTTGTTTTSTNNSNVNTTTNYNNCYMSDTDFAALKKSIQAESFSEDQLRVANMAAKNKCMSVAQIKEIMALFSFSAEQLSFAKAAYDNCTNKSDYYLVMDSFTYSSDKEELENYINSKK